MLAAERVRRRGRLPAGLPGTGPVRFLPAGPGLWLVAATAPLRAYGRETIERGLRDLGWVSARALAHERVIEHVARAGTVLPLKLFTLFASDERAVAHVRQSGARLRRLLARIRGRQEWGARLVLDEASALRHHLAGGDGRPPAGAGTTFLLRKQRQQVAARRAEAAARAEADRLFRALARRADSARRRAPLQGTQGRVIVLEAAFLVRRSGAAAFRGAARAAASRLRRQGLELTLTGPWPPYTFVSGSA